MSYSNYIIGAEINTVETRHKLSFDMSGLLILCRSGKLFVALVCTLVYE